MSKLFFIFCFTIFHLNSLAMVPKFSFTCIQPLKTENKSLMIDFILCRLQGEGNYDAAYISIQQLIWYNEIEKERVSSLLKKFNIENIETGEFPNLVSSNPFWALAHERHKLLKPYYEWKNEGNERENCSDLENATAVMKTMQWLEEGKQEVFLRLLTELQSEKLNNDPEAPADSTEDAVLSEAAIVSTLCQLSSLLSQETRLFMTLLEEIETKGQAFLREKNFSRGKMIGFDYDAIFSTVSSCRGYLAEKMSGYEGMREEGGNCGHDCVLISKTFMNRDFAENKIKFPKEEFPLFFGELSKKVVAPHASQLLKSILGSCPTPGALGSDLARYAQGKFVRSNDFEEMASTIETRLKNQSPVIVMVSGDMFKLGHWIIAVTYYEDLGRFFVIDASAGLMYLWSRDELKFFMDQDKYSETKILQNMSSIQVGAACLFGVFGGACWIKDTISGSNSFARLSSALEDILAVDPEKSEFHRYNCVVYPD